LVAELSLAQLAELVGERADAVARARALELAGERLGLGLARSALLLLDQAIEGGRHVERLGERIGRGELGGRLLGPVGGGRRKPDLARQVHRDLVAGGGGFVVVGDAGLVARELRGQAAGRVAGGRLVGGGLGRGHRDRRRPGRRRRRRPGGRVPARRRRGRLVLLLDEEVVGGQLLDRLVVEGDLLALVDHRAGRIRAGRICAGRDRRFTPARR